MSSLSRAIGVRSRNLRGSVEANCSGIQIDITEGITIGRDDADDCVRPAVEREHVATNVPPTKELRPQMISDDRNGRRPGLFFLLGKIPAAGQGYAERSEIVRRQRASPNLAGFAETCQRVFGGESTGGGDLRSGDVLPYHEEILHRDVHIPFEVSGDQCHQGAGVCIGQFMPERRISQRNRGGRGRDRDRDQRDRPAPRQTVGCNA